MDPKVLYWTGALINMATMMAIALSGLRQIQRGEVARHRRSMLISASLVVAFLLSYVVKVIFLGQEDLASWEPAYVNTLRFHEGCILLMVVGGGFALMFGRALKRTSAFGTDPEAPEAPDQLRRRHRIAGRTALTAALLALASASIGLVGMYGRAQ